MTDTTLLYVGIFCFSMMVLGLGLTVHEFRKLSRSRRMRDPSRTDSAPAASDARFASARSQ